MYWLLVVVLFHADHSLLPDVLIHSYATQAACDADLVKAGKAMQVAGYEGYESGGMRCEAVSNPLTEKAA